MAVPLQDRVEDAALIARLADGKVHSGTELLRTIGAGRNRLTHAIRRLRALGADIESLPGRGYRLPAPVELLEPARIRAMLGAGAARIERLDVLFEVDSTNTRLLTSPPPPVSRAQALLCEIQSAGRGRRGRVWSSPFGSSLALSLGWSFREARHAAPSLSLAVGVAIVRALDRLGARGMRLKWPNDVWLEDRKIGGVLVELKTEAAGPAYAVIGIGLNLRLSAEQRHAIEAGGVRIAAVADAAPAAAAVAAVAAALSRNMLAAALLDELLSMLEGFESEGFAPFRAEWLALDALAGRPARVLGNEGVLEGVARGVDVDGALLLESGSRLHRFVSGEVSLRVIEGDA
jgi:BirA family transcriptional regulator, biotin operon repressor / biotin---[acetyl-CoA-carboxylase] ligase